MILHEHLTEDELYLLLECVKEYHKKCELIAQRRIIDDMSASEFEKKYRWAQKADDVYKLKKKLVIKSLKENY
jgi:hypothetical protein